MTLKEVTHQLFQLSTDGRFNGQQFTEDGLRNFIASRTQKPGRSKQVIMEMNLPDGSWLAAVTRMPNIGKDFYDYFIPENRERELAAFGRRAEAQGDAPA